MPARKSDHRKSVGDAGTVAVATVAAAAAAATPDDSAASQPRTSSPAAGPGAAATEKKDKEAKDKEHRDKDAVTIEDLTLPKSIITRLAKGVLPPNTQIQANAILAMSKSATVFINYLASHANEHTVNAGKKTVLPADVFRALDDTEFSFLREPLEAEFAKFNAIKTEKRTSYRAKVKSTGKDEPAKRQPASEDTDMADQTGASHGNDTIVSAAGASSEHAPRAKKARVDHDETEEEEDDDVDDDDNDDDAEQEAAEEDEDDEGNEDEDEEDDAEGQGSGDETQDALEEREAKDERDEALDGDESD
ncbi:CBF/NF-Y family transcription factor [Purpureocillium lilacinum]|uniref:DNA polymerase epsilon subunit D n=1 Tax=Purpureocillium lilacinum TaxID=33203 RepID=A0A179GWY3_PURLI|nr:CBF/NF-Y family transcription factor [Purpureocillium lilacinum]